MREAREAIRQLVIAIHNLEKLYSEKTPGIGRQSSELWLLYALDDGEPHSQKQVCEEWAFPRATLNTVIKRYEAAGYLTLNPIPGKRREMQICLTQAGRTHADQMLEAVHRAEDRAMEKTLEACSVDFVDMLECFVKHLKASFEQEAEDNADVPKGRCI